MNRSILSLAALSILFTSPALAQDAEREDLGLAGCPVSDDGIAASASGFVVAGCDAPKGVYYSFDFGESWTFAAGGEYEAGQARGVYIVGDAVFARIGAANALYRAELPSSTSWVPEWQEISTALGFTVSSATAGQNFLITADSQGNVRALSSAGIVVGTSSLPSIQKVAVGGSYVYALASAGNDRTLHRSGFNQATGEIGGTWSDISNATGIPADNFFWNVSAAPDGSAVYLGCRDASGPNFIDGLFRSTDNGTTFVATGEAVVHNSSCFQGTTHLVKNNLSLDAGASFTTIDLPFSSVTSNRIEDKACVIDPNDATRALIATNQGFSRVNGIGTTPSFTNSVSGFESVLVKAMNVASDNPDRVMLGTSSGVAFTDNFTAESPTWLYPICPGNDCVGGERVLIDPTDSAILYYASGNIRRGTVTGSGESVSLAWGDYADHPSGVGSVTSFNVFEFAPRTLYVSYLRTEGQVNGGVYSFDLSSDTPTAESLPGIEGIPVSSFWAVSSLISYAAVASVGDTDGGIYRSIDGGVTFERISISDVPTDVSVQRLAYDGTRDILYAATGSSDGFDANVLVLPDATKVDSTWRFSAEGLPLEDDSQPAPGGVSALAVQEESGVVYASGGNLIWVSTNQGQSWRTYYIDLDGASTNVLEVPSTDSSEAARSSAVGTFSTRQLIQGGNTGFAALGGATVVGCSIAKAKSKKDKKASKGSSVKVSFEDVLSSTALAGVSFEIQELRGTEFRRIKRGATGASGEKTITVKPKANRATLRVISTVPECESSAIKVKAKKK